MIFAILICDRLNNGAISVTCLPNLDWNEPDPDDPGWRLCVTTQALIQDLTVEQINRAVRERLRRIAREQAEPPDRTHPSPEQAADN